MTPAVRQFANELDGLIRRYAQESDITFAEMIGALEFRKTTLVFDATYGQQDSGEDIQDPGEPSQ